MESCQPIKRLKDKKKKKKKKKKNPYFSASIYWHAEVEYSLFLFN